jgi:hypothetical protein
MPNYEVTFTMRDTKNGTAQKMYSGVFADDAAALTAVTNLMSALDTITDCTFEDVFLKVPVAFAGVAGTNPVFETANLTLITSGADDRNFKIPSADDAIFNGNLIDSSNTDLQAFLALFQGANSWKIAGDEEYTSILTGVRAFVNSGKTNLR